MAVQAGQCEQAEDSVLAGEHDPVVAEQRRRARAEVQVARVEVFLIGRRERLAQAQPGERQLKDAVAEVNKEVTKAVKKNGGVLKGLGKTLGKTLGGLGKVVSNLLGAV